MEKDESLVRVKFSIIIPTRDRPELLALAVQYALSQKYKNIELIVSDNSTTPDYKKKNKHKIEKSLKEHKVLFVSPDKQLSVPEHFEFALQYATGDYVLFLTDKMMLLPDTLTSAAEVIKKTEAEIVNWGYFPFNTDNYLNPKNGGTLVYTLNIQNNLYKEYEPLQHLKIKSSGLISRQNESMENYIKGKLCFGCFSKNLLSQIIKKSGSVFGGATHDYSAMVQGLCLAKKCAILEEPGILFVGLPENKSLGMLTCLNSGSALKYYKEFTDTDLILTSLLVPGVYSSQHNMVAHDYKKYLKIYDKFQFFGEKFWLSSILNDFLLPNKVWISQRERQDQIDLFYKYIKEKYPIRYYFYKYKQWILKVNNTTKKFLKKVIPFKNTATRYYHTHCASLEAAINFIISR